MAVDNSHHILMFFATKNKIFYKIFFNKIIATKKTNQLKVLISLYFQRNCILIIIEQLKKNIDHYL